MNCSWLGVPATGRWEDNVRLCRFIYRNLEAITRIVATQDTHTAMQIFHPIFWVNENGEHPKGGQTTISFEDVKTGKWKVNPAVVPSLGVGDEKRMQRYVEHYVRSLQETGKYSLIIWPYHSMRSGIGHALVSAVEEAVFFHGVARKSAPRFTEKGSHPLTEHYSVLYPEVRQDEQGAAIAQPDRELIELLFGFDALIIAGQAKSHCVAWTIDSLLEEAQSRNTPFANRIYALEDCMSPVVVPGAADFTEPANRAFRRFAEAGIHLVKSTDPMPEWPGINP